MEAVQKSTRGSNKAVEGARGLKTGARVITGVLAHGGYKHINIIIIYHTAWALYEGR